VQATDRRHDVSAYGAQIVHMPFGSVYTSLQTGVSMSRETASTFLFANKHYEVRPPCCR